MKMVSVIDGALAWVRVGKVFKQLPVYERGDRLYVPHSGGYVRIESKWGNHWPTHHPHVVVYEATGVILPK